MSHRKTCLLAFVVLVCIHAFTPVFSWGADPQAAASRETITAQEFQKIRSQYLQDKDAYYRAKAANDSHLKDIYAKYAESYQAYVQASQKRIKN